MTFRNDGSFSCDSCSDYIATGDKDFHPAWEIARDAGWRAYKGPDKLWAHSCPSCTEDFAKRRQSAR